MNHRRVLIYLLTTPISNFLPFPLLQSFLSIDGMQTAFFFAKYSNAHTYRIECILRGGIKLKTLLYFFYRPE